MKKTKWIAAALLAAALAFVACKNIEEGGEIQQPPAPEQGSGGNGGANQGGGSGEQTPGGNGAGENLGGEEGNEGANHGGEGGGENPGGEEGEGNPQPENPTTKAASDLLKEILTETEYNRISGELSSKGITLTAQTIKEIGDNFSVLVKDAENGSAQDTTKEKVNSNKELFVAQDKNLINVTKTADKYSLNSYNTNVVFSGEFNLDEISLPDNNGKGDFTNATLTNNGESIIFDEFDNIRGNTLPTLSFDKNDDNVRYYTSEYNVSERSVYDLYKTYSKNLDKLKIKGDFSPYVINGKEISGDANYTLFEEDGNTVKNSSDDTIKSLPIDVLIQMYQQLGINRFVNMIISGTPTSSTTVEVDWTLTNMVFEGDMSNIKQIITRTLTGIVYFEDNPYNNVDRSNITSGQEVKGLLKLDDLKSVSYETFGVSLSDESAVLDVRGVNKNSIDNYNNDGGYGILAKRGFAHAIYFSDKFSSIKGDQDEINKLCYKFSKSPDTSAGFINAYLGKYRVNGESYNDLRPQSVIGAKEVRSLKEFEDFGNYFENNYMYKFEKTAKETYIDDWDSLSTFDRDNLELFLNKIAQTNKRIEFIDPETQKIIFSLANDRQYNS